MEHRPGLLGSEHPPAVDLQERLHRLGNLTPITRPHNSRLKNQRFATKKAGIRTHAAGLKVHLLIVTSGKWTRRKSIAGEPSWRRPSSSTGPSCVAGGDASYRPALRGLAAPVAMAKPLLDARSSQVTQIGQNRLFRLNDSTHTVDRRIMDRPCRVALVVRCARRGRLSAQGRMPTLRAVNASLAVDATSGTDGQRRNCGYRRR